MNSTDSPHLSSKYISIYVTHAFFLFSIVNPTHGRMQLFACIGASCAVEKIEERNIIWVPLPIFSLGVICMLPKPTTLGLSLQSPPTAHAMRRSCASRPPGRPISYSSSPNCLSPPISPMFAKPRAEPPPVDLGSPASCPPCPGHTVVRRADRPGRSVMRSSLPRLVAG
jgi:hypothetical protein